MEAAPASMAKGYAENAANKGTSSFSALSK
jgi:hypothetical protein